MRDADTGTLITQQGCGTINRPECARSHSLLESCRKGWFVERLAGQHTKVLVEQAPR